MSKIKKKPSAQAIIFAEKKNKMKARKAKGIPTSGKINFKRPKPGMSRKDI